MSNFKFLDEIADDLEGIYEKEGIELCIIHYLLSPLWCLRNHLPHKKNQIDVVVEKILARMEEIDFSDEPYFPPIPPLTLVK
jgi:hypothetical protein